MHLDYTSSRNHGYGLGLLHVSLKLDQHSAPYLHLLQHTAQAGRLAGSWSSGDVKAGGEPPQHLLLQEGPDGGSLGLSGQETLGDGGVEGLLHALEPGLCRRSEDAA